MLLLGAAVPGLSAIISGRLVAAAFEDRKPDTLQVLTALAICFAILVLVEQGAAITADIFRNKVVAEIDGSIRSAVRGRVAGQRNLSELETPAFGHDSALATQPSALFGRTPGLAATGQLVLFQRIGTLAIPVALLAQFSTWLAVAILVGMSLLRVLGRRQFMALAEYAATQLPLQRKSDYLLDLLLSPQSAKEQRVFEWGDWGIERWRREAESRNGSFAAAARSVLRRQVFNGLLAVTIGTLVAFAPGLAGVGGTIGVGQVVEIVAASMVILQYSSFGIESFDLDYGLIGARAFERVQATPLHSGEPTTSRPSSIPRLTFENLSYTYPGAERPTINHLNLEIEAGEIVAIVGDNGAGKSTLVKLLAGLYPPARGTIRADGLDIRHLDVQTWRRTLAVVYQDFVRYPTTIRENVSYGAPEVLANTASIEAALEGAGLSKLIRSLDNGIDTELWKSNKGGVELSGGEWQRLALARSIYGMAYGRGILILDEPTAQLDVNAEASFFNDIIARVDRATVILISHRLSTVRNADRIIFIRDGTVFETGSHEDLMTKKGEYARLFNLQAKRFSADRPPTYE